MADIKLTQLPESPDVENDDLVMVVTDTDTTPVSKKAKKSTLMAGMASSADLSAHESRTDNPHQVTKAQVGLDQVPNLDARPRSTHTGTQPMNTITGLSDALSGKAAINHTQTASTITDLDDAIETNADVDANTAARHGHTNKALLDSYTHSNTDIGDAIAKEHTHTNKGVLDATTASFTTADENKLDGIATDATKNSPDATLLNRANHTGTQEMSTITGLQGALNNKSDVGHNHDSRYNTKTEISSLLSGKANTSDIPNSIVESVSAGANVTVDNTDPANPVISSSAGGAGEWGEIAGTLSDQTDLQNALNTKADDTSLIDALPATVGTNGQVLKSNGSSVAWQADTNTTYSEISEAEITTGTASNSRTISGRRAQAIVTKAQTTVPTPTNSSDAANKKYVDDEIDAIDIPAAQINADWNSSSGASQILNKPSLGALATKDEVAITDIDATGTASASTYLRGDGSWQSVTSGGGGGQVDSVVGGSGISVNNSDPENPVVSATDGLSGVLSRGSIAPDGEATFSGSSSSTFLSPGVVNVTKSNGERVAIRTENVSIENPSTSSAVILGQSFVGRQESGNESRLVWESLSGNANHTLQDKSGTLAHVEDLSTVATSGDYTDLDNKPTLGTAATSDVVQTAGYSLDDVMSQKAVTDAFSQAALDMGNALSGKVDKVTGKQLSDENYTSAEKGKLANIEAGAEVNEVTTADLAAKAPTSRSITAGTGLTGGGNLTADRTISLSTGSQTSLGKADTAVQPGDLGALATKDEVSVSDIDATGSPTSSTYLRGDGTWGTPAGGGGGGAEDFTDLGDVPANYSGAGGKFVAVNSGATGLEFVDAPGGGGGGGGPEPHQLHRVYHPVIKDVYNNVLSTGSAVQHATSGLEFYSAATNAGWVGRYPGLALFPSLQDKRFWTTYICYFSGGMAFNHDFIFGMDAVAFTIGDKTRNGVRFYIDGVSSLQASNANGTSETKTNVFSHVSYNRPISYTYLYNKGINVQYYVDGTLAATHTTNIGSIIPGNPEGFIYRGKSAAESQAVGIISIESIVEL